MIYEVAITPGIFLTNENISTLYALQNLLYAITKENHLIGVVRKKLWRPMVYAAIASLKSPVREKIGTLMKTLKDRGRLVPRQYQTNPEHPPQTDPQWLTEFLLANSENPFDAIVTLLTTIDGYEEVPDHVHDVETILDAPMFQNYERSRRVKRKASEFTKVLRPLLLHSRCILLVDPHINPTLTRYRRPIAALINTAFDRGRYPAPAFFEIHLKAKEDVSQQESEIKRELVPLMKPGCHVRVVLWAEKDIQETFHNRFILTDLCGIKVGQGLDEPKHGGPDYDDWDVMGENHRQEIWRQFQRGSTTFDQKHEFYVAPT